MSSFFKRFFSPIRWVWNRKHSKPPLTEIEGSQRDKTNKDAASKIMRLSKWGDRVAKNIMRPRADMVAIEQTASLHDLVGLFRETAYSRIPVYANDLDHIVGIIYAKDLLGCFGIPDFPDWKTLMRPPFFIPENKRVDSIFTEFQSGRIHFAIVVNEYGETQGLVTLEDVLEELVGEIHDEYDEPSEEPHVKITESEFVFEARTPLDDACRVMGLDADLFEDERDGAETLGGLLMAIHGAVPPPKTQLEIKGLLFKVLEGNNQRIESIKVTLPSL